MCWLKAMLPAAATAYRQLGPEELRLQMESTNGKRGGSCRLEQAYRYLVGFQPGWFCKAKVIFPEEVGRVASRV